MPRVQPDQVVDLRSDTVTQPTAEMRRAMAVLSGVQPRTPRGRHGILDPEEVRRAIRTPNITPRRTSLVSVETTHNPGGGTVYPLEALRAIRRTATEHGLAVHLDGARRARKMLGGGTRQAGIPVKLGGQGIKAFTMGPDTIRMVTHKDGGARRDPSNPGRSAVYPRLII